MTKSGRHVMEILEAFDLTHCDHAAAELTGVDPTYSEGPLRPHEVSELADLLNDLDAFMTTLDQLPEDLRLRITWWAFRLENTGARR